MSIDALDSVTSSPIAFAQSVVDERNANSLQGAQAVLAKKQLENDGKVVSQIIDAATNSGDGRKLLAKA